MKTWLGDEGSFYLREAQVEDAYHILPDIRPADRAEWDVSVVGGLKNLSSSITNSDECWTVVSDRTGLPVIIWGVMAVSGSQASVWMVASNEGQRNAVWLCQVLRPVTADFFRRWPRTGCLSDSRNTSHHLWLEWLGFKHVTTIFSGPYSVPFRLYVKEPPADV